MRVLLDVTSRSPFVALRDAMLCIDCEFVTPAGNSSCSICAGHRLVVLTDLLGVLVERACGSSTPARLVELANQLVREQSGGVPLAQN
jgi:hypothetical protein